MSRGLSKENGSRRRDSLKNMCLRTGEGASVAAQWQAGCAEGRREGREEGLWLCSE